jgi:protein ImuA
MVSLVASAKIRTGSGALALADRSIAALAANATSFNSPLAMQRLPSKAVHTVFCHAMNYPDKIKNELYPGINNRAAKGDAGEYTDVLYSYSIMPKPLFLAPEHAAFTIWRADELASPVGAVLASGHAALDAQLPAGGWPVGGMVEILQLKSSHDEWRLLLPALARCAGAVLLVGAPHAPFGPGLAGQGFDPQRLLWVRTQVPAQRLWACEQALRCAQVTAVLAWLPQARADQLRRLQTAASNHAKLLFVMRPASAREESSPAVLRLVVSAASGHDALTLHVVKRRGPSLHHPLTLPARAARLAALLVVARRQAAHVPPQVQSPLQTQPEAAPALLLAQLASAARIAGGAQVIRIERPHHALGRTAAAA